MFRAPKSFARQTSSRAYQYPPQYLHKQKHMCRYTEAGALPASAEPPMDFGWKDGETEERQEGKKQMVCFSLVIRNPISQFERQKI